jgi:hypothetical protein
MRTIKLQSVLTVLIVLSTFIACNSDQEILYKEIKDEYLSLINSDHDDLTFMLNRGDQLKSKIKTFLLEYPSGKKNQEIRNILDSFDDDISEFTYKAAIAKSKNLTGKKFSSYDQAVEEQNKFINELADIKNQITSEKYNDKLDALISEQNTRLFTLEQESNDYHNIVKNYRERYTVQEAENEISIIQSFLNNYENSIVKEELSQRIENLHYIKFKIFRNETPQTVHDIRDLMDRSSYIMSQIRSTSLKDSISKQMQKWENDKYAIFENEWRQNIESIKTDMISSAASHCNNYVHDWCATVISNRINSCSKTDYVGKTILKCNVILQAKGGVGCSKIYSVGYDIIANIEGDVNSGVRSYVENVSFLYDKRL